MKLYMFRMSLKAKENIDFFEQKNSKGESLSREEWLKLKFMRVFDFEHRGNRFYFVPEESSVTGLSEHIVAGWIGRGRVSSERTPPSEGLRPIEHESWQAALILIDPTHHIDGQKVALEYRSDVGHSDAIIASVAAKFNEEGRDNPYSVSVFPILESGSLIDFINENINKINKIEYDVSVPNMFNNADDFSDELKKLRDKANVSRVKTKLISDGVIKSTGLDFRNIGEHVEKGGGGVKMETIDGKRYDSDDHAKSEFIDDKDAEPESTAFWERIRSAIERFF